MYKILIVCMGNICRSPTVEGVLLAKLKENHLLDRVEVASAGTHAYHIGEAPDLRSQQHALQRGIDLSSLRAQQVTQKDFTDFDLILAADQHNYQHLLKICPVAQRDKVKK